MIRNYTPVWDSQKVDLVADESKDFVFGNGLNQAVIFDIRALDKDKNELVDLQWKQTRLDTITILAIPGESHPNVTITIWGMRIPLITQQLFTTLVQLQP